MSKTITAALLLFLSVAAGSASAQNFFVHLTFNDGASGIGTFTTDTAFSAITKWNFTLSGSPTASHNFSTSTGNGSANLANGAGTCPGADVQNIQFANAGATVTICLATTLGPNGATVDAPGSTSCAGQTCAQATSGVLVPVLDAVQVNYTGNLTAGDSSVNMTNTGVVSGLDPVGDICVNVYVFSNDEQMLACCSCPITPNGLETLSVDKDLIGNTLTAGVPSEITTLLMASTGTCNPANVGPLAPGLRAWGTTLHNNPVGGFTVTENRFLDTEWGAAAFANAQKQCAFIQALGSGHGICGACRAGAGGANRQ